MRMNVNGMGFDEIAWLMLKLEKLNLSTKIDVLGDETILSTELDVDGLEKVFVELDEENSEIVGLENIVFP